MVRRLFFAWIEFQDSFDAATHAREDEQILSLAISQSEGEFARAEIEIADPAAGLGSTGRQQWALISVETDNGVQPLFKGRLTTWPLTRQSGAVRLELIAQPADWSEQYQAWLETLKLSPWFDPLFVPEANRDSDTEILAARSALPHWDRITHAVGLSDILEGWRIIDLGDRVFEDWDTRLAEPPIARIDLEISVDWEQYALGEVDAGAALRAGFGLAPDGQRVVNTLTPASFERAWDGARPPKGYAVKLRSLEPTLSHGLGEADTWSPTASVSAADYPRRDGDTVGTRDCRVPRVWYDGQMILEADYEQKRRELVTATITSALQDLALVDQRSETLSLTLETPTDLVQGPAIPFTAPSLFIDREGGLSARGRAVIDPAPYSGTLYSIGGLNL